MKKRNIKAENERVEKGFPKNPDNITKNQLHKHFDSDSDGKVTLDEYKEHIEFHCKNPDVLEEKLEQQDYERGFKYAKGGKTWYHTYGGKKHKRVYDPNIDYFDKYTLLPQEVYTILLEEGELEDYQQTERLLDKVEAKGWTFDFGLDNSPYGIRPIGEETNLYAKGGTMSSFWKKSKELGKKGYKKSKELAHEANEYRKEHLHLKRKQIAHNVGLETSRIIEDKVDKGEITSKKALKLDKKLLEARDIEMEHYTYPEGPEANYKVKNMSRNINPMDPYFAKGGNTESGSWSIEISEDDDTEKNQWFIREQIARLINDGKTSGTNPTWTLTTNSVDKIGSTERSHISEMVSEGYGEGEIEDDYAKGGEVEVENNIQKDEVKEFVDMFNDMDEEDFGESYENITGEDFYDEGISRKEATIQIIHNLDSMDSEGYDLEMVRLGLYAKGGEIYKNYTDFELRGLLAGTKIEYQRASRNNWYDKILQRQNRFGKIKEVLDERGVNLTEFERKLFNEENQDKYAKGGFLHRGEEKASWYWDTQMDRDARADFLEEIEEDVNLGENRFYMKGYKYDDLPTKVQKEIVHRFQFAKGGEVKKKGNEMIMGGLAGILLGIFFNK